MLVRELAHRCTLGRIWHRHISKNWRDNSYRELPLVVLDKADNVVFLGKVDKVIVVVKQLDSWLRHQYVHAALNGVFRDRVVSCCHEVSIVINVIRYFKCTYCLE